ncbi:predicted protein [Brucella abortus bv. 4 str. 292]|nr:predicted protein [Brucella abortus bv. 4 str. 292]EEX58262.1 predicted protein [Brucella abortus bv. 2 str. 86/8/59]EEX62992.1 predicted protein [Brucella abortus bv. 6 str. 870]EEX83806.1 predicted protein [Brucella abortus bv. 3 str. Tulya]
MIYWKRLPLQICHTFRGIDKIDIFPLGKTERSFIVQPSATLARGMKCVCNTRFQ